MWWFAIFLMQDVDSQAERVRASMATSIAQQRESVRKQEEAVATAPGRWNLAAHASCDPVPAPELTRMIDETSQQVGIDSGLVREVARQESGFRPCAVSAKGAEGLMQLMPTTQMQFAVSNPFDPKESLDAGSKLLKQLLGRYHGDLALALSAYNAGSDCVDRTGGVPDIAETKNYVRGILSRAAGLENVQLQDLSADKLAKTAVCQSAKAEK